MNRTQVQPDPLVVKRQGDLFDLWTRLVLDHADDPRYDPDDDPAFVTQAREIMGLPPFSITKGHPYPGQRYTHGWKPVVTALSRLTPDQVQQHLQSGIVAEKHLGGNCVGAHLVQTKDGASLVVKTARQPWGRFDTKHQADAEQLSALVGHAVGLSVPRVARTGPNEVAMDYIHGMRGDHYTNAEQRQLLRGRHGRLVGLLDVITANDDRHPGNWIVDDNGGVVPVDNGLAWNHRAFLFPDKPYANTSAAIRHIMDPRAEDYLPTIRLSPTRLAGITERVQALRPEFEALGRGDWHDYTMRQLRQIAARTARVSA